jgi:hypothetical protein
MSMVKKAWMNKEAPESIAKKLGAPVESVRSQYEFWDNPKEVEKKKQAVLLKSEIEYQRKRGQDERADELQARLDAMGDVAKPTAVRKKRVAKKKVAKRSTAVDEFE